MFYIWQSKKIKGDRSVKSKKLLFSIIVILIICVQVMAKVSVPSVIGDNMVLQQQAIVPIWGQAAPDEKISVKASWNNESIKTTAGKEGNWAVKLKTSKFGGPYTVTVKGKNILKFKNVLIGEVWVCSGQSNMEMHLNSVLSRKNELANANYPDIRLFAVQRRFTETPQKDCIGAWSECSPDTAEPFSAVAYFFGREIYKQLGIPVGLIHTSWGGTPAEAWTSRAALEKHSDLAYLLEKLDIEDADTEKIEKKYRQELNEWHEELSATDAGMLSNWKKNNLDDSEWEKMLLPTKWENAGHEEFDGIVWFRKQIDIPTSWKGKDLMLELGPIDDMDTTWFNGTEVAQNNEFGLWNVARYYKVPACAVDSGKNDITIRVLDTGGAGGVYGKPNQLKIYPESNNEKAISLAGDWKYKIGPNLKGFRRMPSAPATQKNQYTPTMLYNGMLTPVIPYGIRGAIWYQGESNAGRAYQYRTLFPVMINCWRQAWGQGDFPFYFTQIAPYKYNTEYICPELQEAQAMTLSLANTGMAVTTDIGNATDIHPRNKQFVGKRLALWALAKDYGQDIVYSGPIYKSMQIEDNKVRIHFDHTGSGLMALGGIPNHFVIAGKDKQFEPAIARIQGDSLLVHSDKVETPVAVRYAWSNIATGNLYNLEMLPASPFRTDDWPGVTFGIK
jgi:sialate O-acetylesterase